MFEPIVGDMKCTGCGEILPVTSFPLRVSRCGGLKRRGACYACKRVTDGKRYERRKARNARAPEDCRPWLTPTMTPAEREACRQFRAWSYPVGPAQLRWAA